MSALSIQDVHRLAETLAKEIAKNITKPIFKVYGVPRGGVPAVMALIPWLGARMLPVDEPEGADIIVDDVIDSGTTRKRYPNKPFYALIMKSPEHPYYPAGTWFAERMPPDEWVVFPWESTEEQSAEDIVIRLLQFIGEDVTRGGLLETPGRVINAWREWTEGYELEPGDVLKTFEDGATDEMVIVRDIEFYSHCEHHLAPFFGKVHIGYIPQGKIVGLSKLIRLVDVYAHRLQVQERMTQQIATALMGALSPLGVAVVAEARHFCMESRGVRREGSTTITSAMRGAMLDKPEARAEFLKLIKGE